MKVSLDVTRIKVIVTFGANNDRCDDEIQVETAIKNPAYPYKSTLSMCFNSAIGNTEQFLEDNFPDVPVERIYK
jgi:hypothetical protein